MNVVTKEYYDSVFGSILRCCVFFFFVFVLVLNQIQKVIVRVVQLDFCIRRKKNKTHKYLSYCNFLKLSFPSLLPSACCIYDNTASVEFDTRFSPCHGWPQSCSEQQTLRLAWGGFFLHNVYVSLPLLCEGKNMGLRKSLFCWERLLLEKLLISERQRIPIN